MNRWLGSRFVVGVWFLLLVPPRTEAATLLIESLDWVVADADLVVQGTITAFDRERDKEEYIWSTATVKVAAVLKGEKQDEIKFMARHKSRFASDRLANLARDKGEVLLCLVKSDRYKPEAADYGSQPWALRLAEGEIDHTCIDLSEKTNAFAVALTGNILTKKEDILKTATAAAVGKKPTLGRLRAPASSEAARKLAEGGLVWLLVPQNERLEAAARAWLKDADLETRLDGVKALRPFKSEENIRLLKDLLMDKQTRTEGQTRHYPVRLAAYELLVKWEEKVPRPVTEEPAGK